LKFLAQNIQICPFYEGPKFAHVIKSDFTKKKKLPGSVKLNIFSKTKHILNPYNLAHRALMTLTPGLKGHVFMVENLILNFKIERHDIVLSE
jgi:hypothetical protein